MSLVGVRLFSEKVHGPCWGLFVHEWKRISFLIGRNLNFDWFLSTEKDTFKVATSLAVLKPEVYGFNSPVSQ